MNSVLTFSLDQTQSFFPSWSKKPTVKLSRNVFPRSNSIETVFHGRTCSNSFPVWDGQNIPFFGRIGPRSFSSVVFPCLFLTFIQSRRLPFIFLRPRRSRLTFLQSHRSLTHCLGAQSLEILVAVVWKYQNLVATVWTNNCNLDPGQLSILEILN